MSTGFCSVVEGRVRAIVRPRTSRAIALLLSACLLASPATALALGLAGESTRVDVPQVVETSLYALELPAYWDDRVDVSVTSEAGTPVVTVSVEGYPELVLVKAQVIGAAGLLDCTNDGFPAVAIAPLGGGSYVVVRALNYADMSAGNAWASAYSSDPAYPGIDGERLAVDLSTGGAVTADEMWTREASLGVSEGALDFYWESFAQALTVED